MCIPMKACLIIYCKCLFFRPLSAHAQESDLLNLNVVYDLPRHHIVLR